MMGICCFVSASVPCGCGCSDPRLASRAGGGVLDRCRGAGLASQLWGRAADGDGGGDERAAVGGALDAKLAVEGGETVREPLETASLRPGAADPIVADVNGERAVLDPRGHFG